MPRKVVYPNGLGPSNIVTQFVEPDSKDIMRAEGLMVLRKQKKDDGSPFRSNASKMSKLITDPYKLVRRAKAVSMMYGYGDYFKLPTSKPIDPASDVFAPFAEALEAKGFTKKQINEIAAWKLDPKVRERNEKMSKILEKMKQKQTEKQ